MTNFLTAEDIKRLRHINLGHRNVVKQIADDVAMETGIPVKEIYGPSRKRRVYEARRVVMFVAFRQGMTYSEIGRLMNRDHSSVMHAVKEEAAARNEQAPNR